MSGSPWARPARFRFARRAAATAGAAQMTRRSMCGAKRRRTPARAASWRSVSRTAAARPRATPRRTVDHTKQRSDAQGDAEAEPRVDLFPRPPIHADLAALAAFASADEDRAALAVEVTLRQGQGFADAQAGAPQHDDQRSNAQSVWALARDAHDRHHLLDRRRICRVAQTSVAWRTSAVKARQGRRPTAATGSVETRSVAHARQPLP